MRNNAAETVTSPATSVRRAPSSRDSAIRGQRDREREDADRDVDEEDPAPPEAVGQETADQRARGTANPRGAPDGKRSEEVVPAVLVADDRQRRCEERGAPDPLQPAGDIERRDVPGEAAEERGQGEEHDAAAMKTRRRPYLSASAPAVRINAARLSA